MEKFEYFKTNRELIIEKTLEQISNSLKGDNVNRSFFFIEEKVDYTVYLGQSILDDDYFFTIHDHETPEAGDHGL